MKLALIGTGKIIEDALFAMEPVKTIERTAVFARPHSRDTVSYTHLDVYQRQTSSNHTSDSKTTSASTTSSAAATKESYVSVLSLIHI